MDKSRTLNSHQQMYVLMKTDSKVIRGTHMSLPTFPATTGLTRENAINQILSSIAIGELAISHILNAEGEKIQYAKGVCKRMIAY